MQSLAQAVNPRVLGNHRNSFKIKNPLMFQRVTNVDGNETASMMIAHKPHSQDEEMFLHVQKP